MHKQKRKKKVKQCRRAFKAAIKSERPQAERSCATPQLFSLGSHQVFPESLAWAKSQPFSAGLQRWLGHRQWGGGRRGHDSRGQNSRWKFEDGFSWVSVWCQTPRWRTRNMQVIKGSHYKQNIFGLSLIKMQYLKGDRRADEVSAASQALQIKSLTF